MSINLRSMAVNSLEDFVKFMKTYASGNDFGSSKGGEFHEGQFLQPPMLRIRLIFLYLYFVVFRRTVYDVRAFAPTMYVLIQLIEFMLR